MVRLFARVLVTPAIELSGRSALSSRTARIRRNTAFRILCWLKITDFDHFLHRFSYVTVFLPSHIYLPLLIVWVSCGWFCPSLMYCVKFWIAYAKSLGFLQKE